MHFLDAAVPTTIWVVVIAFVFIECAFFIGMFLPGDSLLLTAGVLLAQSNDQTGAWALGVATAISAIAGNQTGFVLGRYPARLAARRNGRIINRRNLERARSFFDRWGFWSIVLARWIPWVRSFAPMVAGAAGMNGRRFLLASVIGAVVWGPVLIMLGYYGAGLLDSLPWLKAAMGIAMIAFFVLGTAFGLFRFVQEMRKPVDKDADGDADGDTHKDTNGVVAPQREPSAQSKRD